MLKNIFETDSSISIVCNISSEVSDILQTLESLKFCSRCRGIENPVYQKWKIANTIMQKEKSKEALLEEQVEQEKNEYQDLKE